MPRPRALIADGDAQVRAQLKELLQSQRLDVLEARDAAEAETLIGREPVAVAFLDVQLAQGLELVSTLRDAQPRARAIVLSGSSGHVLEALEAGAEALLPKPFRSGQVRRLLAEAPLAGV